MIKQLKEARALAQQESEALVKAAEGRAFTVEETTKFNEIEKRFNDADSQIAILEKSEARAKQLAEEAEQVSRVDKTNGDDAEQRAAFFKFMRGAEMSAEERAAIVGTDGQALIPKSISDQIEVALRDRGDFTSLVNTIVTASGGTLTIPTMNTTEMKAKPMDAYGSSDKDKVTFGKVDLEAYTYRTPIIPISVELLDDAAVDVEQIIVDALAECISSGLNEGATLGTGTKSLRGFTQDAKVGVTTVTTNSITYDNVVDLMASVKRPYSKKGLASFVGNSNTQAELLKIKDTTGRPIFVVSTADGAPDTVMGYPYIINEDMEDVGAGKTSLAFGDFKKYYLRLVQGIRVKKFNELLGENLAIGIMAFLRADGKLADAGTNPVKVLKHKAA